MWTTRLVSERNWWHKYNNDLRGMNAQVSQTRFSNACFVKILMLEWWYRFFRAQNLKIIRSYAATGHFGMVSLVCKWPQIIVLRSLRDTLRCFWQIFFLYTTMIDCSSVKTLTRVTAVIVFSHSYFLVTCVISTPRSDVTLCASYHFHKILPNSKSLSASYWNIKHFYIRYMAYTVVGVVFVAGCWGTDW